MLQNFYEPGERASSDPSIFTFSSASGERVCDLWLINERAKPLARSARLAHQACRARSAHCQPCVLWAISYTFACLVNKLCQKSQVFNTIAYKLVPYVCCNYCVSG